MAFTINLQTELISESSILKLKFTDITGTSATTGWNAALNTAPASIATLTINVTKPDGTTTGTYNLGTDTLSKITSLSDFVTGVETFTMTHDDMFGVSGTLIDGNYDVVYSVTFSSAAADASETKTNLFYKTVHDCISSLIANLTIPKCECKWDTLEIWMMAAFYMDTLKAQACLGEESKFLNTLSTLENICTLGASNCQPCNC